jgi:serine/threonine protein kinase
VKLTQEVRVWAKLKQSLNIVQYITTWIENYVYEYDRVAKDNDTDTETESNESTINVKVNPLMGRILFIQMELCRMTLSDAITKMGNELKYKIGDTITKIWGFIATQFFEEIIYGVQYLHSSSPPIIHRDLKPANIFVTDGSSGNYIKIGDFGVATFHFNGNESSTGLNINNKVGHTQRQGTPKYMAPEVLESKEYNEMCDIYSLGCVGMDLLRMNW